jgi:hypothetical protein
MSYARFALPLLALSTLVAVPADLALAQQQRATPQSVQPPQAAPPKPYKQVAVTLPSPNTDPSFEAFRKQLVDIANRKDRAALAKLIASSFFWMNGRDDKADKRKSGIDNFAEAFDLDAKDGSGWEDLADFAEDNTLQAIPQRRGVSCAPAHPNFDVRAAEQLAKDTGTAPGEWGYPLKAGVEVHGSADAKAPIIDRLGMYLVRILPDEPSAATQSSDSSFLRVVTPTGKVGFALDDDLESLDADHLCYIKDASGWRIAGYLETPQQ